MAFAVIYCGSCYQPNINIGFQAIDGIRQTIFPISGGKIACLFLVQLKPYYCFSYMMIDQSNAFTPEVVVEVSAPNVEQLV
ncbi:hypothetical protein [Aneurinibacillus aneurinilyticus]|uniref:hypothetical protein n=1 Tax=Aneurinibacillus aneurinilyticus TaxID=1391 RepID=UPI0023F31D62|nr:hypothetical protein [Aneurinibacillus aneurinilyticus]